MRWFAHWCRTESFREPRPWTGQKSNALTDRAKAACDVAREKTLHLLGILADLSKIRKNTLALRSEGVSVRDLLTEIDARTKQITERYKQADKRLRQCEARYKKIAAARNIARRRTR